MNQFIAILKDSFREAIDSKVLWVLLGLSALVCLVTASISFEPEPPESAFAQIVRHFTVVFPDQGKGKLPVTLNDSTSYAANDIKQTSDGYSLRLTVKPSGNPLMRSRQFQDGVKKEDGKASQPDAFRFAVVNWQKPGGKRVTYHMPMAGAGMPFQALEPQPVSQAEEEAVTDADLEEFIRQQFASHAGMTDVTVTRIKDGVKQPDYAFDVSVRDSQAVSGWPTTTRLFFGAVSIPEPFPLGMVLWFIEEKLINRFGASLTLLIAIVITGFFIPNMLRKGALDLLITKPISRPALLIYKYIGGLIYMLILSVTTIGGIWLVLALRSGYWNTDFLLLIPVLTFTFAILYAFSTLIAVLTRSAIAAILLTCGFAFFLFVVGVFKFELDKVKAIPDRRDRVNQTLVSVVDIVHDSLPRSKDLDRLTTKLISDATLTRVGKFALTDSAVEYPPWGETFGVSSAFIVVMLGLACWRFQRRDS